MAQDSFKEVTKGSILSNSSVFFKIFHEWKKVNIMKNIKIIKSAIYVLINMSILSCSSDEEEDLDINLLVNGFSYQGLSGDLTTLKISEESSGLFFKFQSPQ